MIIDSHAHYAHRKFDTEFTYVKEKEDGFEIIRSDRETLISELKESGIVGFIEPSIDFDSIEKQLELVSENKDFMYAAVGVHPTRCMRTVWKNRKKLFGYARRENVVAIGETGLDYHHKRKEQHRFLQKRWFRYQLSLAEKTSLPVVLHIRLADRDALKILRRKAKNIRGGVVHCFTGDSTLARQYTELGFALGIGGKLLCNDEIGDALRDTVKNVPLAFLLVETDAPFVLPEADTNFCHGNQKKKQCNSSFILPRVIEEIARIRGEEYEKVESAMYSNTLRVFGLKELK